MICSLELQMDGNFPPTFPTDPRYAVWSDLHNVYHDDGGVWNFDDARSINHFIIKVTYVYRSFSIEDVILEISVCITQDLTLSPNMGYP